MRLFRRRRRRFDPRYYQIDTTFDIRTSRRAIHLGDPYQKSVHRTRRRIIKVVGLVAVLFLIEALLQAPIFALERLTLQGVKHVDEERLRAAIQEELNRRRLFFFKNSNYFLFRRQSLTARLTNEFYLRDIAIQKKFPPALEIRFEERLTPFGRQAPGAYYAISYDGGEIQQIELPRADQIVIADERTNLELNMPFSYLEKVTIITELWQEKIYRPSIVKFHITDEVEDMILTTSDNYSVALTSGSDLGEQIDRIKLYLADIVTPRPTEYIDARFGERLFVK